MSGATTNPNTTTTTTRPSPSTPSSSSSPTQACAACKYQRRKCNPDCTLAPYFPADQQRQFLNAHRLFGVSNILKIIRNLDPIQRGHAMHSIVYESNRRAQDPVGGCYRMILELQHQLDIDRAELELVHRQLAVCRSQAAIVSNLDCDDGMYNTVVPAAVQQQQHYYDYFCYDGGGGDNSNTTNGININNDIVDNSSIDHEILSLQQQCGGADTDVKPLMEMFDMKQAFVVGEDDEDSNAAAASFLSSGKVDSKEEDNPMEHVQEHDLKGAASLFTLTNCNTSTI